MKISILSIGDELLSGDTINTNFSWISNKVTEFGAKVERQITCQDVEHDIGNALEYLLNYKTDYVIVTGGLGPTEDDITRDSIFRYFNINEEFDNDYWEKLKLRYNKIGMEILDSNKSQAIIPSKGEIIDNPVGSARGFCLHEKNSKIIILPGVPLEMKAMMKKEILPTLEKKIKKPIYRKTLRTTGYPESLIAEKIRSINEKIINCKIGYYPSLYGVDLRISSTSKLYLEKFFIGLSNLLQDMIFTTNADSIEKVIVNDLIFQKKTIAFAESCTGGLIGDRITNVPNSSQIFLGGLVTYSNQSKTDLLNISSDLIKDFGAVSEAVAIQMSERVREKFNANYGLAVTGIAGPGGGTVDKPVGTVFISISNGGRTKVKKFQFGNNREKNKLKTSQSALNMLRLFI